MSDKNKPSQKLSGYQNLVRNRKRAAENEIHAKAMAKFLVRKSKDPTPSSSSEISSSSEKISKKSCDDFCDEFSEEIVQNVHNVSENSETHATDSEGLEKSLKDCDNMDLNGNSASQLSEVVDIEDIAKWPPTFSQNTRDEIISCGPKNMTLRDSDYPVFEGRHFSNAHFTRKMGNGESYERQWLLYSKSADKVFCFCCKLFRNDLLKTKSSLVDRGSDDWSHLSRTLKNHETSSDHIRSMLDWSETERRLKCSTGIDKDLLKQIEAERNRWRQVLERILAIVLYLSQNDLAFRGTSSTLNTPHNGNFLGLVQLFAKFDPVMENHIRRVSSHETNVHYCGPEMQNEFINLLGEEVKSKILQIVKNSKYFGVILDCTPDKSHKEQMSFVLRAVDLNDDNLGVAVREFFITYREVSSSTGEGLSNVLLDLVKKECDLDMNDCRGQGYDNAANMKGNKQGVQTRILNKYPRASYTPCGCHSMNLVIADAAKSSVKSVSLFGIVQRIYVIFAGSTKRWAVICVHVQDMTVKQVCETRWEGRVASLRSLRYQYPEVCKALEELYEDADDPVTASDAQSLLDNLKSFEFILTLVMWYDVLFQVNFVSKEMQSETADLEKVADLLNKCQKFVSNYRETGYVSAYITAREIAENIGAPVQFEQKRWRRKKKLFGYEGDDETPTDPEVLFKAEVFYPLIDTVLTSLTTRFEMMQELNSTWSFLYDLQKTPSEKSELMKYCADLQLKLTDGDSCDINAVELCDEILSIKPWLEEGFTRPIDVLRMIKKNNWMDLFPNLWIALRILLTITVTVANGERSFSKLKLIKTYLRSTMANERLNSLAVLSIENELSQKINFQTVIDKFARIKSRKVPL